MKTLKGLSSTSLIHNDEAIVTDHFLEAHHSLPDTLLLGITLQIHMIGCLLVKLSVAIKLRDHELHDSLHRIGVIAETIHYIANV